MRSFIAYRSTLKAVKFLIWEGISAQSSVEALLHCFEKRHSCAEPSGRVGLRLAHLRCVQTGYQQRVQDGDLRLKTEPCDTNVSDALTKP